MKKYSIEETESLANQIGMNEFLIDINQFIEEEGCTQRMPVFLQGELVLNMDLVEKEIAKHELRNLNKSMDSAFIITDNIVRSKEILLVEFRFNYEKGLRNLDRKALLGKVSGSMNILNNILDIHDNYYFIFDSNLKQQAINRLRRMNPVVPSNFIATDINDLKSIFF